MTNTTTTEITEPCMHCKRPVTMNDDHGWFFWAEDVELLDDDVEPKPGVEEGAMHRDCAEQYQPGQIHEV